MNTMKTVAMMGTWIRLYVAMIMAGMILTSGFSIEAQPARNPISPARQINHPPDRIRPPRPDDTVVSIRSFDGSANNLAALDMGAANTPLLRLIGVAYADGVSALAGPDRPSPCAISNAINAQDQLLPNPLGASDFLWQWGQFLDHDIDLTDGADPPEVANIAVPTGDAWFDPEGTGEAVIPFNRSVYAATTGTTSRNPREQVNEITAWIDASNVYGVSAERVSALRTLDGTGRLRTSAGNLLPLNTSGLPNAGGESAELFLAGDVRANEQVGLTAMHTLFVREHNRLAASLAAAHPELTGDDIYQRARAIVMAEMQVITYHEFLPALLGPDALAPYRGYNPNVDARIANVFSTAAYRFGHSALSPTLLRLDAEGNPIAAGHLALRDAFFAPWRLIREEGIEPLLRGLASQRCQRVDPYVVD